MIRRTVRAVAAALVTLHRYTEGQVCTSTC
jgi:hypothetical protein